MKIKLLLVDDHPNIRDGLRMLLGLEADMMIIGEASDGDSALSMVRGYPPDVVIMDVEMPGTDGITATHILSSAGEAPAIVMLSIHDDALTRTKALAAGAADFISKCEATQTLVGAIRQAGLARAAAVQC